jgi:hypothetical protein
MLAVPCGMQGIPLDGLWVELLFSPCIVDQPVLFQVRPPTGEPCAGDLHARFGGEGDRELNRSSLPLSNTRAPSGLILSICVDPLELYAYGSCSPCASSKAQSLFLTR